MTTYTLKSIAKRGSMLVAAAAILAGTVLPTIAYADALNPLTKRSLLLSSSAPGFQNSDGAGNTADNPNSWNGGEYYAPPGSGPNGQKTGETFSFNVSTDSAADPANKTIRAFTLQYCTTAAGLCQAPGNNDGDGRTGNAVGTGTLSDPTTWDGAALVPDRDSNATAFPDKKSDLEAVLTGAVPGTDFEIWNGSTEISAGWTVTVSNVEDKNFLNDAGNALAPLTGKNNFITISNATGFAPAFDTNIRIVFKASDNRYITNPGEGAFFVKINTYNSATVGDHIPATPASENDSIIDGGVTVANVMTDSIHITTKVLETMSFSVGTRNRDTVTVDCLADTPAAIASGCEGTGASHGTCDPIQQVNSNRLQLGNPNAEYSLEVGKAWDVYSYWRLSSNSSGGATVYYSGDTLRNTVGDEIAEMGAAKLQSTRGTEQFGIGFVDAGTDTFDAAFTALVAAPQSRYKNPTLRLQTVPSVIDLAPEAEYANGTGHLNNPGDTPGSGYAEFAFEKSSQLIPEVIAQNNQMVISCATAKMRYVANIGADTPAGVYTTKINYLAAPQY